MNLDITYCYLWCEKGKKNSERLLNTCESVFDAAFDFQLFTEACFNTCPYTDIHTKNKEK